MRISAFGALFAAGLLSAVVNGAALAVAPSSASPAGGGAETTIEQIDPRVIGRELALFRNSPISLGQAMAIAEALHAGSTTADISFDGSSNLPVYRVKTLHANQVWQHAIDATTGNIVGVSSASEISSFGLEERGNLAALKTIRQRLSDAVAVAENATAGKAISGGLVRDRGRLSFAIVVMSGGNLKEVILEPPSGHNQKGR